MPSKYANTKVKKEKKERINRDPLPNQILNGFKWLEKISSNPKYISVTLDFTVVLKLPTLNKIKKKLFFNIVSMVLIVN